MIQCYSVYAIYSQKGNRVYVGMSADIDQRLKEHNSGQVRSTQFYKPWIIIYREVVGERKAARLREKYFKSGCGKEFLKKLVNIPR